MYLAFLILFTCLELHLKYIKAHLISPQVCPEVYTAVLAVPHTKGPVSQAFLFLAKPESYLLGLLTRLMQRSMVVSICSAWLHFGLLP